MSRGEDEAVKEKIDLLLQEWGKEGTPGVAAAVLRNGKVAYTGYFGLADTERGSRIGEGTVFELASVTKPITALAVMMLREREKLSYESRLGDFLTDIGAPDIKGITIRQLLTHTSGLPEYDDLFLERKLIHEKYAPRSIKSGRARIEPTSADVRKVVAGLGGLEQPPGGQFKYSNTGYALLSEVIAEASGRTYHEFVKGEIFEPLGMSDSFVFDLDRLTEPADNFAVSYDRGWSEFHDIDYTPLNLITGDGSARSTLADMLKFAEFLDAVSGGARRDGRGRAVISPETFAEATAHATLVPTDLAQNTCYGFGWIVNNARGRSIIWHTGMWTGFKTALMRIPEEGLTIILLSNIMQFPPSAVACNIASIFLGEFVLHRPPDEEELSRFVKLYPPAEQVNPYDGDVDVTLEPDEDGSRRKILWLKTPDLEKFPLTPVIYRGRPTGDFFARGMEGFDLFRFSFQSETPAPVTGPKLYNSFSPTRQVRNKRGFKVQRQAF